MTDILVSEEVQVVETLGGFVNNQPAARRLGEYLRWLRRQLGHSNATEVSMRLGWKPDKLGHIESRRMTMPDPEDIRLLADFYGVTFDHLSFIAGWRDDDPGIGVDLPHAHHLQREFERAAS